MKTGVFVWQDTPWDVWPDGYDTVCVKLSDGKSSANVTGFSWLDNTQRWMRTFPGKSIGVWQVAYPDDGDALANIVLADARHADYVILDIEDWPGVRWTDESIHAIIAGFRRLLPDMKVGYTTYPTRGQCEQHGIDQYLLDALLDFSVPQVYYPYQAELIRQVAVDNRHVQMCLAPGDNLAWQDSVKPAAEAGTTVWFWRMGISGWQTWGRKAHAMVTPGPGGPDTADVLRPARGPSTWPGRFVAWDGQRWWLTDMLWRRELSQEQAQGLVDGGVPVAAWWHVASETGLITPS